MNGLRPALFAPFTDLARLRHELPVVLLDDPSEPARSLRRIVDDALRSTAPRGPRGERLRRHVLGIEREIRGAAMAGATDTLFAMWDRVAASMPFGGDGAAAVRAALGSDGEVVALDAGARVTAHAWRIRHERRAREIRARIDALVVRLEDILRADLLRSPAGRRAPRLRAAVGPFADVFDLDEMAHVLGGIGWTGVKEEARERIAATLRALRDDTFFRSDPASFFFGSAYSALSAYRARVPAATALASAIAAAERIAVEGDAAAHERMPAAGPRMPDPFVHLRTRGDPGACLHALEALLSGIPVKVLIEVDDLADPAARLASMALGLGDVFVLQTTVAQVASAAARISRAMAHSGPALVAVYTGEADAALPPYLVAAAASEARAFPSFVYDPSAGPSWAERFALDGAAPGDGIARTHELAYADDDGRRLSVRAPFTFADLALCDPRMSDHFAVIPRERWDDVAPDRVVFAVDDDARLYRLAIDADLAGLVRERAGEWERWRELAATGRPSSPLPPAAVVTEEAAAPAAVAAPHAPTQEAPSAEPEPAASPEGAYIETPRCSTCNECTKLNPRMFKYNENKQAYIADVTAGTFRELVEAAENCQVAVIHPGKPRDPSEPGLADLLERARAFA